MARPKVIDDQKILDAARELFISDGFAVSTSKIAKKAGISEGSIFRRFPTKHELFMAAMGLPKPDWFELLDQTPSDFWEHMERVAVEIVEFFAKAIPQIVLIHTCLTENRIPADAPPVVALLKIEGFLERNAHHSPHFKNPAVASRVFLGSLHNYSFMHCVGIDRHVPVDRDEYITMLLKMLGDDRERT